MIAMNKHQLKQEMREERARKQAMLVALAMSQGGKNGIKRKSTGQN
jgi:hypothetical protein